MTEPRKTCAGCAVTKPWSEFWAKAKWPDGSTRQPHARCKDCWREMSRERQRLRRLNDPEGVRALDRARYHRNKRDREWLARRREIVRRAKRKQKNIPPERWRVTVVDDEPTILLPIGPFREWVSEQLETGVALFCERASVTDRIVWRWFNESERIELDSVDRVICALGEPQLLAELYPELYEEAAA